MQLAEHGPCFSVHETEFMFSTDAQETSHKLTCMYMRSGDGQPVGAQSQVWFDVSPMSEGSQ
jgi:hypothetical protein